MPPRTLTGTKGRLLFLQQYLMEFTDEEHSITTNEIILLYKQNGYQANRNTIRDDVASLNAAGIEVAYYLFDEGKAYHIGKRLFSIEELKILIDALHSYRYVSRAERANLIDKLGELTSANMRKTLTRDVFTVDQDDRKTPFSFENIKIIHEAIDATKKIRFHYWDYSPEMKRIVRRKGAWFNATPYALIWNEGCYYLAAKVDYRTTITTFRLNHMCNVTITKDATEITESFNASEYITSMTKLMGGYSSRTEITLICDNQYIQDLVDRFGEDIVTDIIDEQTFRAKVNASPCIAFFSWVFSYCGGIRIATPLDVKKQYEKALRAMLKQQTRLEKTITK